MGQINGGSVCLSAQWDASYWCFSSFWSHGLEGKHLSAHSAPYHRHMYTFPWLALIFWVVNKVLLALGLRMTWLASCWPQYHFWSSTSACGAKRAPSVVEPSCAASHRSATTTWKHCTFSHWDYPKSPLRKRLFLKGYKDVNLCLSILFPAVPWEVGSHLLLVLWKGFLLDLCPCSS